MDREECGSFVIFDPDGNDLFFNTNPGERRTYELTHQNPIFTGPPGWPPGFTARPVPMTVDTGEIAVCLNVTDLGRSMSFYLNLGSEVDRHEHDWAVLRPGAWNVSGNVVKRSNPPYILKQSDAADIELAFLCPNPDAAARAVEGAGIRLDNDGSDLFFQDPDDRSVMLISI